MSDRRTRLAGIKPLKYDGTNNRLPYTFVDPGKNSVTNLVDIVVIDKRTLFPDDLLKVALDACASVRDPPCELIPLGNLLLLAFDRRAFNRHGYSSSPDEAGFKASITELMDGLSKQDVLNLVSKLYDDAARIHSL